MFVQGDIVAVNMNPVKGHEQGNFRPVVILNSVPFPGGLNLIAPITSKSKTYPLEILLDTRTKTQGCILCFQLRTLDLQARNAKYLESLPQDLLENCIEYVKQK